jgi:RNA polymerase sigma factor (TIGR02999 family)
MDPAGSTDLTGLLRQWRRGDTTVEAKIVAAVYDELRRIARRYTTRERTGNSLQATALVNEAYLRLVAQRSSWKNRAHFFGVAATVMRRILIDRARRHRAGKRGDAMPRVALDDTGVEWSARDGLSPAHVEPAHIENVIAVDEALTKLAAIDPRQSRIVELRFFAGMTSREISEVLEIGERTVEREWALAQAWLYGCLRGRPRTISR